MANTSDSPLVLPADDFTSDEKPHRANNSALRSFSQIAFLGLVPTGGVIGYAGSSAPAGWLECNGAAINRRAYKELFSIIGTTYGVGDGSTTFNLPDATEASDIFGGVAPGTGILMIRSGAF